MSVVATDSFTEKDNWKILTDHSPEMGGPIVNHPLAPGTFYVVNGRAICRGAAQYKGVNYYAGVPASADYTVSASVRVFDASGDCGVAGRIVPNAWTFYYLYLKGANELVMAKMVGGNPTTLATFVSAGFFAAGQSYLIALEMIGTAIKGYVDGVVRTSATDSAITGVGRGGLRGVFTSDTSAGKHLDGFSIVDTSTPSSRRTARGLIVGL